MIPAGWGFTPGAPLELVTVERVTRADEKLCASCAHVLPLASFYRAKLGRHGREAVCIECRKAQMRNAYRERAAFVEQAPGATP